MSLKFAIACFAIIAALALIATDATAGRGAVPSPGTWRWPPYAEGGNMPKTTCGYVQVNPYPYSPRRQAQWIYQCRWKRVRSTRGALRASGHLESTAQINAKTCHPTVALKRRSAVAALPTAAASVGWRPSAERFPMPRRLRSSAGLESSASAWRRRRPKV